MWKSLQHIMVRHEKIGKQPENNNVAMFQPETCDVDVSQYLRVIR
jgi:hypothetical protein